MSKHTSPRNFIPHRGQAVDALAARAWLNHQCTSSPGGEEAAASLRHYRVNPENRNLALELPRAHARREFFNALNGASLATGGVLLPEGFIGGWIRAQSAVGAIRNAATVYRVGHGGIWNQPWCDGRDIEGEILVENRPSTPDDDVEFARGTYRLHRFASRSTRVPNSLLEDSPGFDEQLGYELGEQVARRRNRAFTHGTGVNEPVGIVPHAVQVPAASTGDVTLTDLKNLLKAVGDAHADPSTSALMVHKDLFASLCCAATSDVAVRFPFRDGKLFGLFPVLLNPAMDSTAESGKKTVVFGNFARYGIAEAGAVELQAAKETYIEYNQTVFRAVQPCDGKIMQPADNPFAVLVH